MKPCVTAIVPVFNGAAHLRDALESIRAQSYRPVHVIVVDDGSSDGSASIARSFPEFEYIWQPNAGVATARNTALRRARGDFIAFLDQDDRWTPDKLDLQMKFMENHPETDFVYCRIRNVLEVEKPRWLDDRFVGADKMAFMPGALLARRSAFDRVGGFDPSFVNGSDTDWQLRAKDAGLAQAVMEDVLLLRRVHTMNESRNYATSRRDMFHALHGSIRRRKAASP
jgi:glycosyltransferase involved in cell wall biosynthesis